MNSFIQSYLSSNLPDGLTLGAAITILVIAFVTGLFIAGVYRVNTHAIAEESRFAFTLTMVCMIVAAIMAVIGSNLTLSLGLVGALSIIRFRTVIKSPLEMTFLFWAIAEGLSIGAQVYTMALVSTFFIAGAITLLTRHNLLKNNNAEFILTFHLAQEPEREVVTRLFAACTGLRPRLRSSILSKQTRQFELTYAVAADSVQEIERLLDLASKEAGIGTVTVLHPESNLFV